MSARSEVTIEGEVVKKRHAPGTDAGLLARQLALAASEPWSGVLLSPLSVAPEAADGRLVTRWPRVRVLSPEDETFPWREAGALLARLQALAVPDLPPHGGRARLARALVALRRRPDDEPTVLLRRLAQDLLDAWAAPAASDRLVHGDFHLGQLGRTPQGALVLLDLDDLGLGDPAWDLGRPAGFHAAGLLDADDWAAFLYGYAEAGGSVEEAGRPWPALDHAARAAVVVAAVRALGEPHSGDLAAPLVAACVRMSQ